MRAIILAVLVAGTVAAETPEAVPERISFTRAELSHIQQEWEAMLQQREAAAFARGQLDVRQRCASLI